MATGPMFLMFRDQTPTATREDQQMIMKAAARVSDRDQAATNTRGRKPKAKKQKKIPQRGMGVAQLERLRAQEKLTTQIPDPPINNYPLISTGFPVQFAGNNRSTYYGVPLINGEGRAFVGLDPGHGTVQVHRLPNADYGGGPGPVLVGRPNWLGGSSRELSSIPKINSHLCFKKKYPNYQESAMYNTNQHPHFNRDHINGFCSTNSAAHRHLTNDQSKKGSSRTFLEYEFFPGKFGTSIEEKENSDAAAGSSEASFVTNGYSTITTTAGYRAYTPIDLSLKL